MKTASRINVGTARAIALAAVLALSFAVPAQAAAGAVVDQQQVFYSTPMGHVGGQVAQTFRASKNGQLDHVSLVTSTLYGYKITVKILNTDSTGAPTGAPLGTSVPQSFTCCPQWHDFTFTPSVQVTAGTRYAIVVPINGTYVSWYYETGNPYADGQMWLTFSPTGPWVSGVQYGVNYASYDFAFKTWVGTAVDSAPILTEASTQTSPNEGTAPAMTGTFSDPDGDTVTLTADKGNLTSPTGVSSGAWSWTEAAADESPAQTVNITATDSHGLVTTKSFVVNVLGVQPIASILTDPPSVPEGSVVPFTGGATSPDPADQAAGFTYTWTVLKDLAPFTSGAGAAWSFQMLDEGTYTVTVQATDDGGMTSPPSTPVTVIGTDITPTAAITGLSAGPSLVIAPQEMLNFSGSFADAGLAESHVATWDFGDGTPVTISNIAAGGPTSLAAPHQYASAGTYTVRLKVADDDGVTGETTASVLVMTPQQALGKLTTYVQSLSGLNKGQMNSLLAKLNAASDALARGDTTAANNQLNAFLNEVQAYVNAGKISQATATTLRATVHAVQAALGTRNRFIEWLPLGL